MVIRDLSVYRFQLPVGGAWVYVKLTTDDGREGWGEASQTSSDTMVAVALDDLKARLRGRDPRSFRTIAWDLRHLRTPVLPMAGVLGTAVSAVDQAVWDLAAQAYGIPLYRLLGGTEADRVPCYANINRALKTSREPADFAAQARAAVAAGFTSVKCAPFDGIQWWSDDARGQLNRGLERLAAVRQAVGSQIELLVDFHRRLSTSQFRQIARELETIAPSWIEEPLMAGSDPDALSHARALGDWCLAGGEALYGEEFIPVISSRAVDVIMPDVKHAGGVTEVVTIAGLAQHFGLTVSFHNPSGPISTAFSAHLSAALPNTRRLEFPWGEWPERHLTVDPEERVTNGCYWLSDRPGIGCRPTAEQLARAEVFRDGTWVRSAE